MKNKSKKLPKYPNGGKKLKDIFTNGLNATGDIALSAVGASNVIKDSAYKGNSANLFRGYSDVVGGIAKAALPMAVNMVAPGSGQFVSAGQGIVGGLNPQDNSMVTYDSMGNPIIPEQRQSQQIGQVAGQLTGAMGMFAKHGGKMPMYPNGSFTPNAEVEKQENTLNPDGSTTQFNGNSHQSGGIQTQLDPGTLIFSDKLKHQGKTFAALNKVNNTDKEMKILNDPNTTKEAKNTAKTMIPAKQMASMNIFKIQEQLKRDKVFNYAKKMGVDYNPPGQMNVDVTEGLDTEQGGFKHGGVQPFPYDNPYKKFKGHIPAFVHGGNFEEDPLGYNPQNPAEAYRMQLATKNKNAYLNDTQTSEDRTALNNFWADPAKANMEPITNSTTPVYSNSGIMMNNLSDLPEDNATLNFTPTTKQQLDARNPSIPGSKFDWGNAATQVGLFGAQNAGNLYDLLDRQKPEVTKYDRTKASLLDDTAAIRDTNQEVRLAERGVRDASGGNAGSYLSNRVALAAQGTISKDRIRQQYGNANAEILNRNSSENAQIQRLENDANEANRAKERSIKQSAIASMGSNTASQYKDFKASKYDQNTIDNMKYLYAALEKDPALKARFEKISKGYK